MYNPPRTLPRPLLGRPHAGLYTGPLMARVFRLPPAALELIQEGLHAKARHTFDKVVGVGRKPQVPAVAAPGAR